MSADYIMAVKSIGLSKVGGRKPCTLVSAAKHNKRETAGRLEAKGRIDGDKVSLNYSLAGAPNAVGVVAMALQLMADIGTSQEKMRRDYCQAVEIVFSLPASTKIDTAQYFSDCVTWCIQRFGAGNILSADVHHDESSPHCHALIAPIQDGRWVGGRLIDRTHTHAMRESFGRLVATPYGLSMVDKLMGKLKGDAVAMVLDNIEKHHRAVLTSSLWVPLRQAIERDPAPFISSLGLELAATPIKKTKTMAQVFTSTGKGAKSEMEHSTMPKPIGIDPNNSNASPIGIVNKGEKHQSLSCVVIAPTAPAKIYADVRLSGAARTLDFELGSMSYDAESYEYRQPPPMLERHEKHAASQWVAIALQRKGGINAH